MALDPVSAVAGLVESAINKIWPDKTEQEKGKLALLMTELTQNFQAAIEQVKVNAVEAASGSVFVAGWRPFVGWVCGSGFAWQFFVGPFLQWTLSVFGHSVPLPALDSSELMTLLLGMLGLGGLRSFDKVKENGKK